MARSNAQLAAAVQKRAGLLREKRTRRWKQTLASAVGVCFAAVCLFALRTGPGAEAGVSIPAGAGATELMGSPAVGGYVLVGVLFFALGIGFALVCAQVVEKRRTGADDSPSQNENWNVKNEEGK
ncbi:MAG: hypothetical protein AB7V55_06630 [Oscillospiraceae bacterium]